MINAPVSHHCHGASMSLADGNLTTTILFVSPPISLLQMELTKVLIMQVESILLLKKEFTGSSETNVDCSSADSDEPATNVSIFRGASRLQSDVNGGLHGALFSLDEEVQVDLLRTLRDESVR